MNNDFLPKDLNGVHVHFVGIKGTGMTALVEIFFHNGAIITGSDVSERFYTDEILEKLGLKPEECIMVGNDYDEDIIPTESLGMKAFLLTDCLINKSGADISKCDHGDFEALKNYLNKIEIL